MKKSRFTEEQVAYALRQAEAGTPVSDVCRQLGIAEATFYVWKKKYANLGVTELRRLRQLEDENARLKHLVADLTLDRHILQEVIKKSFEADPAAGAGDVDLRALSGQYGAGLSARALAAGELVLPQPGP
jgi:putative transposase